MPLVKYSQEHTDIKDVLKLKAGVSVLVRGWVRNTRTQAAVAFIEMFDGSSASTLQVITEDNELIGVVKSMSVGSSLSVRGIVTLHPIKTGIVELKLEKIEYIGSIQDPLTYILNAKKTSLETLRSSQELRAKTR